MTGISLSSSQDILSYLKEKGPTTVGIFKTPPNAILFQTLKDKFYSGEEVDVNNQSVHEVAMILKVGNVLASPILKISLSVHE